MPVATGQSFIPFQTRISTDDLFIEFVCSGETSLDGWIELLEIIKTQTLGKETRKKVLIDACGLTGKLEVLQKHMIGQYIAETLRGIDIAIVAIREEINKVAENTAVNRGAAIYVTHDKNDAIAWLMQ